MAYKFKKALENKIYIIILGAVIIGFIISMLPIFYCSFFNYATGDDLNYSNITHLVIKNHGTIIEFLNGIIVRVKSFYMGWGGNWTAAILWSIQPSIWSEEFYHITLYVSLFWMCMGIVYLSYYWYKKYICAEWTYFAITAVILLLIAIQLMPKGRTAFFWYAVVVNYILPFGLELMSIVWIDKYIITDNIKYLILLSIAYIYIGGSGYMMIVMSFDIICLSILYIITNEKDRFNRKKIIIPFIFYTVSVAINVNAPGNMVRSGETIKIGLGDAIKTIVFSIGNATFAIKDYFSNGKILFVYVIVLFVLTIKLVDISRSQLKYKFIWLKIIVGYLIYCSVYAPITLMGDMGASSGHTNSYWLVFIMWLTYTVVYFTCYLKNKYYIKNQDMFKVVSSFCVYLIALCLLLFLKPMAKEFYAYDCYEYIRSGQLKDYEIQMKERYNLLNSTERDVVVPFMNPDQGPFIHFAIIEDSNYYTNYVNAAFYGKNTVTGMDREEFYKMYGSDF